MSAERYIAQGTDILDRETSRVAKFQHTQAAQIGAAWMNTPDATPGDYEWTAPTRTQTTDARRWEVADGEVEILTSAEGISIRAENITAEIARAVGLSLIETADRYPNVGKQARNVAMRLLEASTAHLATERTLRRPAAVDEALRDREGGV